MTGEHVCSVASLYNANLRAARIDEKEDGHPLEHARWMCRRIVEMVRERDYDKASRWLGFVQGVLWVQGVYSITTMRVHNRTPDEQKGSQDLAVASLRNHLEEAVFPGTGVHVGCDRELITVSFRQTPDGMFCKHWL